MMMEKREDIMIMLRQGVVELDYTKKNGEKRLMRATLVDAKIPESAKPKGNGSVTEKKDVIRLFDVEKNEWRSVIVPNVASAKLIEIVS